MKNWLKLRLIAGFFVTVPAFATAWLLWLFWSKIDDIFAPMYILLNIACIFFFWRFRRAEFNWFLHGLIPVLGALAFIPAFCAGAGIPVFSFISPLPEPLSYAGPAAAIWMLIGLVYLIVLMVRRPDRITETRRVFVENDAATT